MPLTPADIQRVTFRKPHIGKRGFDAEEVDAFLDRVERELVRLIEENDELRSRAGYGSGGPADLGAGSRLTAELDDLKARLDRVQRDKAAAEQKARAIEAELEQARSQGGPPASGGYGLGVSMMAQRTADEHVTQARREADGLLSDARAKAEELLREARARARTVELDARERHQEALETLDARRTTAQNDIKELERFDHAYRTGLKEYLERQLRDCADGDHALLPATI